MKLQVEMKIVFASKGPSRSIKCLRLDIYSSALYMILNLAKVFVYAPRTPNISNANKNKRKNYHHGKHIPTMYSGRIYEYEEAKGWERHSDGETIKYETGPYYRLISHYYDVQARRFV